MKYCVTCGSFVRQWTDKEMNVIHYQCIGCGKVGTEEVKEDEILQTPRNH